MVGMLKKSLSEKYTEVFTVKITINRIYFLKAQEKNVSGREIAEMSSKILTTVKAGNKLIHFAMLSIC